VVCPSVKTMSPRKTAEPIEMSFKMGTQMGPRNHVLDGGPDPPREGTLLRGDVGIYPMPLSGPDVGISLHAVNQHSKWPAAKAVGSRIKFSQRKPSFSAACCQNFLITCLSVPSAQQLVVVVILVLKFTFHCSSELVVKFHRKV